MRRASESTRQPPTSFGRVAWLLLLVSPLACRRADNESSRPAPVAKPAVSAPAEPAKVAPALCIAPEALSGCRLPDEAGCAVCYQPVGANRCIRRSRVGADDYAEGELLLRACPEGPRCATCRAPAERKLRALYPEYWECPRDVGIDPCFVPASRECACDQYSTAAAECPPVPCP